MQMKSLLSALGIGGVLLGASICFAQHELGDSSTKSHARRNEIAKAPEKYRVRPNPMDSDPTAPAAGKILYDQHCAECHAHGADGTRRGPSLLRDRVQTAPPGALFWLVTNGVVRHGMPVWSKLPEPERWQIISYLTSLGPSAGGGGGATRPQASMVAPD
jgi:mono/diheme cytochrome c family protein